MFMVQFTKIKILQEADKLLDTRTYIECRCQNICNMEQHYDIFLLHRITQNDPLSILIRAMLIFVGPAPSIQQDGGRGQGLAAKVYDRNLQPAQTDQNSDRRLETVRYEAHLTPSM